MDATPTACPPTGRILDAAPLVHAVMKDAARAEGPEGPKLLCFELGRVAAATRRRIPASARRRREGQDSFSPTKLVREDGEV